MKNYLVSFFPTKQLRLIVGGLIAVSAFVGAYYVYGIYIYNRDLRAQASFAEGYELYEAALGVDLSSEKASSKEKTLWAEVEMAFNSGYNQFSSSTLAPFFLAFQAEALVRQGKLEDAIQTMKMMLAVLPKRSPFLGIYATKKALMLIDSSDEAQKKEGLEELIRVADDTNNGNRDMALYYLGNYYATVGDIAQAQERFKQLEEFGKQGKNPVPSPWASLVTIS
jgi:tetratricopeptide (TPR) repeat protein